MWSSPASALRSAEGRLLHRSATQWALLPSTGGPRRGVERSAMKADCKEPGKKKELLQSAPLQSVSTSRNNRLHICSPYEVLGADYSHGFYRTQRQNCSSSILNLENGEKTERKEKKKVFAPNIQQKTAPQYTRWLHCSLYTVHFKNISLW